MKTRNISRSALFLLVLMAAFPIASRADSIIFSDFGTGHNYNAKTGLAIGGKDSNPGFVEWGEAFVPKGKFDLSAITMALGSITGSNGVTVSLDTSIGGAPGKTLASWSFLALPQVGTTSSTVQTMTFADAIVLQKGQTYWLVTAPFAANTQAVWNLNSTGVAGLGAVNFGGVWLTAQVPSGAFEVVGKSVVPEPAVWLLFASGLLGIMGAIRIERKESYCGTRRNATCQCLRSSAFSES
ncbi:MAG: choice-of-anchor R domain-containing protein [Candidatus Sulfotelmatobacter sp.]